MAFISVSCNVSNNITNVRRIERHFTFLDRSVHMRRIFSQQLFDLSIAD